jgi:hypothetical protein
MTLVSFRLVGYRPQEGWLAWFRSLCPARVACAGCVSSSPFPCTWLSRSEYYAGYDSPYACGGRSLSQYFSAFLVPPSSSPRRLRHSLCPGFPLRASVSVYRTTAFPQPGANGTSQVLRRISSCMPQPEDSGRLPHARPNACFMLASGYVKALAIRHKLVSKLYQLSGHAVAPTAYRILCVRFTCLVRLLLAASATGATLDTGGWLALARPGLAPSKIRQASLGAATPPFRGPRQRQRRC